MSYQDLHRFVWRRSFDETLQDYCMTRVTFGVSSSSSTANTSVKQNAINFVLQYPLAAVAVHESFYVDYGPTGVDCIELKAQSQL